MMMWMDHQQQQLLLNNMQPSSSSSSSSKQMQFFVWKPLDINQVARRRDPFPFFCPIFANKSTSIVYTAFESTAKSNSTSFHVCVGTLVRVFVSWNAVLDDCSSTVSCLRRGGRWLHARKRLASNYFLFRKLLLLVNKTSLEPLATIKRFENNCASCFFEDKQKKKKKKREISEHINLAIENKGKRSARSPLIY